MPSFTIFTDPGHGWLRVSHADCFNVGLSREDFSRFSYRDDSYLYLEEDCDAPKFIAAYTARYMVVPVIVDSHSNRDSVIRRKDRL